MIPANPPLGVILGLTGLLTLIASPAPAVDVERVERHMDRARTLYEADRPAEALEVLMAVDAPVRAAGDHPSFRWAVARCHERLAQRDAAIDAYRTFLEIAPDPGARRRGEAALARLTASTGPSTDGPSPMKTPGALAHASVEPNPAPPAAADLGWRIGGRAALLTSGVAGRAPRWHISSDLGTSAGLTLERWLTPWLALSGALLWHHQTWRMTWDDAVAYDVGLHGAEVQGLVRLAPGAGGWFLEPHLLVGAGAEAILSATVRATDADAEPDPLDVRPLHAVAHAGIGLVPWRGEDFELTLTARAALAVTTLGAGEARLMRFGIGAGIGF